MNRNVDRVFVSCLRCNWSWPLRNPKKDPKTCPKCKSPYWNKQRKKTIIDEIEDLEQKALRAREEYYQDLKSHHFNEVPRKRKDVKK